MDIICIFEPWGGGGGSRGEMTNTGKVWELWEKKKRGTP